MTWVFRRLYRSTIITCILRINLCTECKFFINPEDPTRRCSNHDAAPTGCATFAAVRFPKLEHTHRRKKIMSLDWHSDLLASAEALSPVYSTYLYMYICVAAYTRVILIGGYRYVLKIVYIIYIELA
ncbi:unnamed protein product [Aphis gossypii]|uniref:Uncharacterized protein n=1 Tax=Aphis gossypii TaxID=80765 RepID=A0A9P0NP81_APHGO|nr:unnamed protein product [Aphis gossypii]